jgi:hypothetical protein
MVCGTIGSRFDSCQAHHPCQKANPSRERECECRLDGVPVLPGRRSTRRSPQSSLRYDATESDRGELQVKVEDGARTWTQLRDEEVRLHISGAAGRVEAR